MSALATNSHRTRLLVLFWLFEGIFILAVVVLASIDPRNDLPVSNATGVVFWISFVGLQVVCFLLKKIVRRLAIVGWITLFGGFCVLTFLPVV